MTTTHKYRTGDTIKIMVPPKIRILTKEEINIQISQTIRYLSGGPMPDHITEAYIMVLLDTEEKLTKANVGEYGG